jgi:hypothetical protein
MKKDVKIWYVIAILAVVGTGMVSIASAGLGIVPDYPEITDVHHNLEGIGRNSMPDDNITGIVVNAYGFIEEEKFAHSENYAQHDNSGIHAAKESKDNSNSRSDSNANVMIIRCRNTRRINT